MNNTITWKTMRELDPMMPDDHRKYVHDKLKEDLSRELFTILEQSVMPAVVEISELRVEKRPEFWSNDWTIVPPRERIWYEIKVTPVQYRHIEIMKASDDFSAIIKEPRNLWQRLRWAITGRV